MNEVLWTLDGVTLSGIERPRLDQVTLSIRAGITAVVGYSGAGKTSLLNVLVGFERPHRGTVVPSFTSSADRLPLFWVPQNYGLWPHMTAGENLRAVMPANARERELADLLDRFALAPQINAHPFRLSLGEQSRLSVARALASRAAVIVMDEPLAHVDPAQTGRYWEAIRAHVVRFPTSMVIATHSPETVLLETSRAVCLKAGRVLYDGSVDDLYHRPRTPELAEFLGPANWVSSQEAAEWLGNGQHGDRCYRPEQIIVTPADEAPFIVRESRFAGSVAEIELLDERTERRRTFLHRPRGNHLKAGDRVWLKPFLAILLCVFFLGCRRPDEPPLRISNVRHWSMPPTGSSVPGPRSLALGRGNVLYVLDTAGRVLVFDLNGKYLRHWMMPDYDAGNPEGIVQLMDGRIAVADTHYHRVVIFNSSGTVLSMFGEEGTGPGQFLYPVAITVDEAENIYVGEYGSNDRVQKFTKTGKWLLAFGAWGTKPGQFDRLSGVVWHDGRIYATDAATNRIQVFTDDGKLVDVPRLANPHAALLYPYDIATSPTGELFVVEYGAGRVSKFSLDGRLLGRFGMTGFDKGRFLTPWGLTVLPDSRILVADTGNRRIVELDP